MNRRRLTLLGALALGVALTATAVTANAQTVPPETNIVGGTPVAEGAFPWMAHLSMGCGGSLISPDIILTAAHCFGGGSSTVTAMIGKVKFTQGEQRSGTQFKAGPGPEKADWAVLKLSKPSSITTFAPIPTDGSLDASPTFRAIGWGATKEGGRGSDILLQVDVPLVPDAQCGAAATVEICAGDMAKGGIDTCQGDSGGPLMANRGGTWVVVGMTSWGEGCARPGQPGHYAKASAMLTDIKAAITALGGQQPPAAGGSTPPTSAPLPTGTNTPAPTGAGTPSGRPSTEPAASPSSSSSSSSPAEPRPTEPASTSRAVSW